MNGRLATSFLNLDGLEFQIPYLIVDGAYPEYTCIIKAFDVGYTAEQKRFIELIESALDRKTKSPTESTRLTANGTDSSSSG